MSEPITLYRAGEVVTTCAPSVAHDLQAQGWSKTPADDCPFDVIEGEVVENIVPVKAKRGRPKKVAQ